MIETQEKVIILDFGSQYTQLIARRIRELGVYSEIVPGNITYKKLTNQKPNAIILSGGPASVHDKDAFHLDKEIFEMGLPMLGICYGLQLMAHQLGGKVRRATKREYGEATLKVTARSMLFDGVDKSSRVWMSHGDDMQKLPKDFVVTATTNSVMAAAENVDKRMYGIQFHPEVVHTNEGTKILQNFLSQISGLSRNWNMRGFIQETVQEIRAKVARGKVICALSGGVDSSVAAALVARAVGSNQTCIFVNTGLLRKDEYAQVLETYKQMKLKVIGIDASAQFLKALKGVSEPEAKRKIIGAEFIKIFNAEAKKIKGVEYLVQGTLYPDVIESVSVKGPSAVIKSHHNVGGLPKKMNLKLIEPLRELFKDEVRKVGMQIGVPGAIVNRQPFPGPGLAIRILGEITTDRITILQSADEVVQDEIEKAKLTTELWQSFAVLLPVSTVGVMGDERTYENVLALRAVESVDGMTADWAKLPYKVMQAISSRIISEVKGINRVVYDISSKPPATIEWE